MTVRQGSSSKPVFHENGSLGTFRMRSVMTEAWSRGCAFVHDSDGRQPLEAGIVHGVAKVLYREPGIKSLQCKRQPKKACEFFATSWRGMMRQMTLPGQEDCCSLSVNQSSGIADPPSVGSPSQIECTRPWNHDVVVQLDCNSAHMFRRRAVCTSSSAVDRTWGLVSRTSRHCLRPHAHGEHSRRRWLLGLLILQSISSVVLDSYQDLLKEHIVVTFFLTMLARPPYMPPHTSGRGQRMTCSVSVVTNIVLSRLRR